MHHYTVRARDEERDGLACLLATLGL
ncbi:unnamed protein product [Spirodela intermedia]|uniref:Uncharacterized protein n=1 Tax=Spirodela intermedia TaxID=51605 RepID=A0A7I8KM85_SPIIN|nr:unnamed protein product [Spirodela intermedia]